MQDHGAGLFLAIRYAPQHHRHRLAGLAGSQGRPDLRLALHIRPINLNKLGCQRQRLILEKLPGRLDIILSNAVEDHRLLDKGPQERRPQPLDGQEWNHDQGQQCHALICQHHYLEHPVNDLV